MPPHPAPPHSAPPCPTPPHPAPLHPAPLHPAPPRPAPPRPPQVAQRILVRPRAIDSRTGVFAAKVTPGVRGEKPVRIEMIDAKTKELAEVLEVDACMVATGRVPYTQSLALDAVGVETERGFVQTNEMMQVGGGMGLSLIHI